MRNLRSRLSLFFNIKSNAALDSLEDPVEVLDYAYGEQQVHLRSVRRGLVEVATARQQLEQQAERLRTRASRFEQQARRALRAGREDLARRALERKQAALAETGALDSQLLSISRDEERLRAAEQQLAQRVERFKFHRSVAAARYAAAEAQVGVGEALSGIGGYTSEETELSIAVERSEERIEQMSARAVAITAITADVGDPVESELEAFESAQAVQQELDALKRELSQEETERRAQSEPPAPPTSTGDVPARDVSGNEPSGTK
jgi:phage shock protein A